jgi:predicted nucleic acid-binding Zn ribbon protein
MPISRLGNLVNGAIKHLGLEARCQEQRAILLWPEVVGEANARRSWPERVEGGVLTVAAANAAWAQELSLLKSEILDRLRERLGGEVVKDIRFRPTRRPSSRPAATSQSRRRPRGPALAEVVVDRQASAAIERLAAEVGDPELRESLRRAMLKMARLRAWRLRHGWGRCERCGGLHRGRGDTCTACSTETRQSGWRRLRLMMRGRPGRR